MSDEQQFSGGADLVRQRQEGQQGGSWGPRQIMYVCPGLKRWCGRRFCR